MGRQRRGLAGLRPATSIFVAALLAAASLLSQPRPTESAKSPMNIDISSLKLPDSAFWNTGDDHDPMSDPIPAKYLTSHFGVLADGPASVSIAQHSALPLFVYFLGSFRQTATRNFPHAAHLVAVDPVLNKIRIASLIERKEGFSPGSPSFPASAQPEGYAVTFQRTDVRGRLHLPWAPGRVISQVIMLDMESNRVETKLIAGTSDFVDPEKERFLAQERAKQDPPAPFPSRQLDAAAAGDPPPAIPEQPGIALSAPRVAVFDGAKPLPLSGSFRLPVFPEELVKPAHGEVNRARHLIQADGATPFAACLAINLVVSASGEEPPYTFTLHLPVKSVIDAGGTPSASGTFAIDLRSLPQFPVKDQTLVIRAYAKDWASPAATIGVIARPAK